MCFDGRCMEEKNLAEKLKGFLNRGLFGFSFESILLLALFVFRTGWNYVLVLFMEENGRRLRLYDRVAVAIGIAMGLLAILRMFLWLKDRNRLKPDPCHIAISAYAVHAGISSLVNYGPDVFYDRNIFMHLLELMIVVFSVYRTAAAMKEVKFKWLLDFLVWFFVVITIVLNVLSIYLYLGNDGTSINLFGTVYCKADLMREGHFYGDDRYIGLYGNTATLGIRVSLSALLAFFLYERKKLPLPLVLVHYLACLWLVFLSDTRSSMINMFIIFAFFISQILMAKKGMPPEKSFGILSMVGAAGAAAAAFLKRRQIFAMFEGLSSDPVNTLDKIGSGRVELLLNSIEMANAKPILGHGWISYISLKLRNAHNLYANAMAWTGYAGLAILLLFTGLVIHRMIRNKERFNEHLFPLCLIICVFLQSLLDKAILGEMANAETYLFWLILGYFCFGTLDGQGKLDAIKNEAGPEIREKTV